MKKLLFHISVVFGIIITNAQNYEYGKVSKAELEEQFHPVDSSASAAMLYRKENLEFVDNGVRLQQKKDVHVKLKIYNSDGFDWATDKVILFNNKYSKEKIEDLEGFTYNLVEGEIQKNKLSKDGIFEEKMSDRLKSVSFTFPNVKKGSVIEYKYTITSPFYGIDDFYLQYSIPINKLDVYVSTLKKIKYNKVLNPRSVYQPTIHYPNFSKDKGLQVNYDRVVRISEERVPALKDEPFCGNINNFRAKLSFEIAGTLTQYGGLSNDFSATWEKIAKIYSESDRFGGEASKKTFYKKDLNDLLLGVNGDFEVIQAIEGYVKTKIKWNGFYGKLTQNGIRDAYNDGEGNSADINLLLVSMLRSRGYNANPVMISTRSNGIPLFPTEDGLNYVLCVVELNGKKILVDATEEFAPLGLLPERVLNWKGLVIMDNESFEWIDLKPKRKSSRSVALNVKLDEDLLAVGKVRQNLTSHNALQYRKKYNSLSKDEHLKSLEEEKGDIEISELIYENSKDISKPVKITYDYELSDGVDEVGDKLYFSPLLFLAMKENPFKLDNRLYPIDFVIPYEDKFMVSIMIPEGYIVESLPKSEAISFKEGDVKFNYVLQGKGSSLQLMVRLEINNPIIQPVDYEDFKSFFSKIVEKQGEQIVLTKA